MARIFITGSADGLGQLAAKELVTRRCYLSRITYPDTKLHVLMLCKAVVRKWTDVYANALNPGWVPRKMGGRGAPDDLQKRL